MFSFFDWDKKYLVAVSGLLVFVFVVSFYQLKLGEMKSRDAQRRSDTEVVARGLKSYFKQYGKYPEASMGLIKSCGSRGTEDCVWGNSEFVDEDSVIYIKNMPRDPLTDQGFKYVYQVALDYKSFRIYARLEYLSDPVVRNGLTVECGNGLQCNWYAE